MDYLDVAQVSLILMNFQLRSSQVQTIASHFLTKFAYFVFIVIFLTSIQPMAQFQLIQMSLYWVIYFVFQLTSAYVSDMLALFKTNRVVQQSRIYQAWSRQQNQQSKPQQIQGNQYQQQQSLVLLLNYKMDSDGSQQQSQMKTLIQFAFCERKYKEAIKMADNYLQVFPQSKVIYLKKALAHSELDQPDKCLQNLQKAHTLGASLKQISTLKIRSEIQLGLTEQAQKTIHNLMNEDQELKKIMELSNAIKIIKNSSQKLNSDQEELKIIEDMNKWLKTSGAQYNKITITNIQANYRGVIATRHIKKNQRIVYIPKSELISLEMAKNHKNVIPLIQKKVKLLSPKHTYLSILLLALKNTPNSKFKPYIDLLPQDHSTFPINFSKEQLIMLEGSPFLKMIYQKVIDLKKDYDLILKFDPQAYNFTFKQFCWARMMIGSRIFGINYSGMKTEVLVPFADMLNHRQPKQTVWNYEESVNGFVIQSLEDIEVGQQVFDSYGRKCNSRFLLNYGFVLQQNIDNEISIRLTIKTDDPLQRAKKQMLKIPPEHSYVQIKKIGINMNNNKFYQCMGSLRFICVEDVEIINMLKKISNIEVTNEPYIIFRTPPLSVKNQLKVWETFLSQILLMIKSYPNTIQVDKQLLKKQKLTQNQRNIIIIRMGEKEILHHYQQISEQVIGILKSENIIQAMEANINKAYIRYLYKILSLTPGINKKNLQKRVGVLFQQNDEINNQQIQEVPEN